MNNCAEKVGEIFREAGNAFNKLGEMTMLLHAMGDSEPGGKWADPEIEMLRGCVHRFAVDLNDLSQHIKTRTVETPESLETSLIEPKPPLSNQPQLTPLADVEALKILRDESLLFNPELVPEEPPADIMQPDEPVKLWVQENYRLNPPQLDPSAPRTLPESELLPLEPHQLTMSLDTSPSSSYMSLPQPISPPVQAPAPPALRQYGRARNNRKDLPVYHLNQLRGEIPINDGSAYRRESSSHNSHRRVESTTSEGDAHRRRPSSSKYQYSSVAAASTSQDKLPAAKKRSRSSKKKGTTPKQDKKKSSPKQAEKKSLPKQYKNMGPKIIMGPPPPPPPIPVFPAPTSCAFRIQRLNRDTASTSTTSPNNTYTAKIAGEPFKPIKLW